VQHNTDHLSGDAIVLVALGLLKDANGEGFQEAIEGGVVADTLELDHDAAVCGFRKNIEGEIDAASRGYDLLLGIDLGGSIAPTSPLQSVFGDRVCIFHALPYLPTYLEPACATRALIARFDSPTDPATPTDWGFMKSMALHESVGDLSWDRLYLLT
jgi:hypothetical protein